MTIHVSGWSGLTKKQGIFNAATILSISGAAIVVALTEENTAARADTTQVIQPD